MRKVNYKLLLLKLGTPAAILAPVAVVVACGESSDSNQVQVKISAQDITKVQISGDTKNVSFSIPKNLMYVNSSNALDINGESKAFDIRVRANVRVGGTTLSINDTFMPVDLLSHYLAGRLSYKNSILVASSPTGDINIQQRFGGTFNFTPQNVNSLNSNTATGKREATFEGKYFTLGSYAATDAKELDKIVNIPITNLKKFVTLPVTESEITFLTGKLGFTAASTADSVTWSTPAFAASDLPLTWAEVVSGVKFSTNASSTAPAAVVWQDALPTAFANNADERNLLIKLTPAQGYVLSFETYDLTQLSGLRTRLALKIDSLPEYAAIDLTRVALSASNGNLVVDESRVTLPEGAKITYQIGNGDFFDAAAFIAQIKRQSSLTPSEINAHLEPKDAQKYRVVGDKKAKPDVTSLLGFVDTKAFFTSLTGSLRVNLATSTPTAIVWSGTPVSVPATILSGSQGIEYLTGDHITEDSAIAASTWVVSLPTAIDSIWKTYNLWARFVPKDNYLFTQVYQDLTSTSQLGSVIPNTDISELTQLANRVAVTSTSTHDALSWTNTFTIPVSLTSAVQSVEYATGNFPNDTSLKDAVWSTTLPTSTIFSNSDRHLWMRVSNKAGFKFATNLYELTSTSGITGVKGKIDALPAYQALDLSKIKLQGRIVVPTIDTTGITLPSGTKVLYSFKTSGWVDQTALTTFIAANAATIVLSDLQQVLAKLEVENSTLNVLIADKQRAINTSGATISSATLPAALVTLLSGIKAQTTSTHDSVVWSAVPALTTDLQTRIASLQFTTGNFVTSAEVEAGATWRTTLPTSVVYTSSQRKVWVKVIAQAGYSFDEPYYNITTSSDITKVKSKVDTEIGTIDLSRINITGDSNNITISASAITLPIGAIIVYQFKGGNWVSAEGLETAIETVGNSLTATDIATVKARIAPFDSNYVVVSDHEASPSVSGVLITSVIDIPLPLSTALGLIRPATTSNSAAVSWNITLPSPLPSSVNEVRFLSGDYADQAAAANAAASSWNSLLPTSVDFDSTKRNLWARVTPNLGYDFTNRYVNLTQGSEIKKILALVDSDPTYNQVDLSRITVSGTSTTPVVNDSVISSSNTALTLPAGSKITYQIKGGQWISKSELITYITTNAATLVPADISGIKAHLESRDTTAFVVVADKMSTVTSTLNIVVSMTQAEIDLAKASVRYTGGVHDKPLATFTPPTSQASSYFASVSYLYLAGAKYDLTELSIAQSPINAEAWSLALPTEMDYDHDLRNLWVRFNPKEGYAITNAYINITGESNIRLNVATNLMAIGEIKYRSMSDLGYGTISLTGDRQSPVLTHSVQLGTVKYPSGTTTQLVARVGTVDTILGTAQIMYDFFATKLQAGQAFSVKYSIVANAAQSADYHGTVTVGRPGDVFEIIVDISGFNNS